MIPVVPQPEPPNFDAECRASGRRWLALHPDYPGRPKDFWSLFEPQIRAMFRSERWRGDREIPG